MSPDARGANNEEKCDVTQGKPTSDLKTQMNSSRFNLHFQLPHHGVVMEMHS